MKIDEHVQAERERMARISEVHGRLSRLRQSLPRFIEDERIAKATHDREAGALKQLRYDIESAEREVTNLLASKAVESP